MWAFVIAVVPLVSCMSPSSDLKEELKACDKAMFFFNRSRHDERAVAPIPASWAATNAVCIFTMPVLDTNPDIVLACDILFVDAFRRASPKTKEFLAESLVIFGAENCWREAAVVFTNGPPKLRALVGECLIRQVADEIQPKATLLGSNIYPAFGIWVQHGFGGDVIRNGTNLLSVYSSRHQLPMGFTFEKKQVLHWLAESILHDVTSYEIAVVDHTPFIPFSKFTYYLTWNVSERLIERLEMAGLCDPIIVSALKRIATQDDHPAQNRAKWLLESWEGEPSARGDGIPPPQP